MGRLLKGWPAWGFLAGLAIPLLVSPAYAANPDAAKPEASEAPSPEAKKPDGETEEPAKGEAGKSGAPESGKSEAPESGKPAKPEEIAAPGDEKDKEASAAGVELMQELQGFEIRTTVLVPAEMVTRQTGTVTPDALVVTLQKETAIAVCYYTLKSYVRLRLAALSTCTMFR